MSSDPIHLHRPSSLAIATAMTALAAAVGFHFLLYGRLYGFGFAFFMILLFTGVNVLVLLTGKRGNVWAYLFAIPFVLSLAAEILYASDVVRGVGFLVAVASLAFFSYWFASLQFVFGTCARCGRRHSPLKRSSRSARSEHCSANS